MARPSVRSWWMSSSPSTTPHRTTRRKRMEAWRRIVGEGEGSGVDGRTTELSRFTTTTSTIIIVIITIIIIVIIYVPQMHSLFPAMPRSNWKNSMYYQYLTLYINERLQYLPITLRDMNLTYRSYFKYLHIEYSCFKYLHIAASSIYT